MPDIRAVIRQILREELANFKGVTEPRVHYEAVNLRGDDDLNAFALKVLELSTRRDLKGDIQSGKFQFVLDPIENREARTMEKSKSYPHDALYFEKALVTEKDIAKLDAGTKSIVTRKRVCFTPLAKDEIRRRGIKIERSSQ